MAFTSPLCLAEADGAGSGGSDVTNSVNSTGALLFIATVAVYNDLPTASRMHDSLTSTWQLARLHPIGGNVVNVGIYYCENPSTSATHTFWTTDPYASLVVTGWSGAAASAMLDQVSGGGSGGSGSASLAIGSVTPTENDELIIAVAAAAADLTGSFDSGLTVASSLASIGGSSIGQTCGYLVQGTAGAVAPTVSNGGTDPWFCGALATFKAGAAGSASLSPSASASPSVSPSVSPSAAPGGHPTMRRWGGVPFLGGQGIGNKGPGRTWG